MYDGPLTTAELTEGAVACLLNAERLRRDAELLEDAGSAATATFLLDTRVEELAKTYLILLTRAGPLPPDGGWSTWWWKRVRSHPAKWLAFLDATKGPTPLLTAAERMEHLDAGSRSDAKFREVALYCDFRKQAGWLFPSDERFVDQPEHMRRLGDWMLVAIGRLLTEAQLDELEAQGPVWCLGMRDVIRWHRDGTAATEVLATLAEAAQRVPDVFNG